MPYVRRKTTYRRRSNTTNRYPKRYKKTGTTRKARYFRPKSTGRSMLLRPKWVNPDSQKALVRFTYTDTGFSRTLAAGTAWAGDYVFRGNGPYDPDLTGIGVQPYSFDQYVGAALYTNYATKSSSIRVYFHPEENYSSIRRLHCMLIPSRQGSLVLSDPSDLRMIPFATETTYDGETESTKGAKAKHYTSTRKVISEFTANSAAYSGLYSGTPSTQWYWHVIFFTDLYSGSEQINILFDVKIRYYTVLARGNLPNES